MGGEGNTSNREYGMCGRNVATVRNRQEGMWVKRDVCRTWQHKWPSQHVLQKRWPQLGAEVLPCGASSMHTCVDRIGGGWGGVGWLEWAGVGWGGLEWAGVGGGGVEGGRVG